MLTTAKRQLSRGEAVGTQETLGTGERAPGWGWPRVPAPVYPSKWCVLRMISASPGLWSWRWGVMCVSISEIATPKAGRGDLPASQGKQTTYRKLPGPKAAPSHCRPQSLSFPSSLH